MKYIFLPILYIAVAATAFLVTLIVIQSRITRTTAVSNLPPPESYPESFAESYPESLPVSMPVEEKRALPDFSSITKYLTENKISNYYGIYFLDINNPEILFEHNSGKKFAPASIYKVALSMLTLKRVEQGKLSTGETISIGGKRQTLLQAISSMMRYSSNEQMTPLENKMGGYKKVQTALKDELGVRIIRVGQDTTAKDIGLAFSQLIGSSNKPRFLTAEHSNFIITELHAAISRNRDRIPAAISDINKQGSKLTAATKIGNLSGVYQDAGIVFGQNSDYVVVILNQNRRSYTQATKEIKTIVQLLLSDLE